MKRTTAWVCLILAGILEIVWAYFLKLSYGLTQLMPTALAAFFLFISFFLLERGIRTFGIGVSYGVFTGIGIVGTTFIGIFLLDEDASILKIASAAILLMGILGLMFVDRKEGQS
jgi:quaternary ammonium compound-resistance protein SugE